MSEHEWKAMNDRDFDAMLSQSVSELPPDDITEDVTPWRRAMNRILFGFALCVITIKILGLDYILPAVGMVLLLLGFRTLRRENGWFGVCFVIAVLRTLDFFADFILNSTIYKSEILTPDIQSIDTAVVIALLLVQILCFWRGLCAVKRKAGLPPTAGAAFAFFVWYVLGVLAALARLEGLIIFGALLISYIFIIVSLCKLSKVLDEAGYTVKPAAVKVTDLCIVIVIAVVVVLGCVAGYIFGSSYDMDWESKEAAVTDKTQEIRAHLEELGFPEDVLNDLTAEDIAACDGAEDIGIEVYDGYENGDTKWDMRTTNIAVKLSGEQDKWIVIHHFEWNSNPGFYGTEALQLWPAYRDDDNDIYSGGNFTGRVLYDKNGKTYASPYHWLGEKAYASPFFLYVGSTREDPFATFSMPADGERCRGYLAYSMVGNDELDYDKTTQGFTSFLVYIHQWDWLQYPVKTAMEARMTDDTWTDSVFTTMDDAFCFSITPDGIEVPNY